MYTEVLTSIDRTLPPALELLIMALCADYARREQVIAEGRANYSIIMEYRFLNYRILRAASEIAGSVDAKAFITEIGSGVGYATSSLFRMSERVYKRRKQQIKFNIARQLCLYE